MTDATGITSDFSEEGPTARTPVQAAFLRLLRALDRCIAAERQLLEAAADDFETLRSACETAGEALTTHIAALLAMPDACPSDRSLQRLAFVLQTVLSIENDADRVYVSAAFLHHVRLFEACDPRPTGPMPGSLERRSLHATALLVGLRTTVIVDASPKACGPGLAA
jgi:hypothetical protein